MDYRNGTLCCSIGINFKNETLCYMQKTAIIYYDHEMPPKKLRARDLSITELLMASLNIQNHSSPCGLILRYR